MSDCIRCHQPVIPGQYFHRVDRTPATIQELMDMPDPEEDRGMLNVVIPPYKLHVDCPPSEESA